MLATSSEARNGLSPRASFSSRDGDPHERAVHRTIQAPSVLEPFRRNGASHRRWMERLVPRISGIITVVQEGRFRLSSSDGQSVLFILDRRAAFEPQDLPALLLEPRVEVVYAEAPGRRALTALEIHAVRQ